MNSKKQQNKKLELIIQPKVIDHLGIKMYQKPVDVVSEFVANSWDADSEKSEIQIEDGKILISDNGLGMTFEECQNYFLTVGRDRRESTGTELSKEKKRPVLGRKGIGKFAGFGIASEVIITTVAKENGEETVFVMSIDEILKFDSQGNNTKPIQVVKYNSPNPAKITDHGTKIELTGVRTSDINLNEFNLELARRFLLAQISDDFSILVNDEELPESFSDEMEYVFPEDLTEEELRKINCQKTTNKNWGVNYLNGNEIKWRVGFYEDTIQIEELRGISIFAKGKLAQKPFFFDLSGGISGQHALEYMSGQMAMDFIDIGGNDLIATERQRINLQTKLGGEIREWGIDLLKQLSSFWKSRRSEKRLHEINAKVAGFSERLQKLPNSERKTVESVLKKIATFPRLGKKRFEEWCGDILTSWETGRLRELITEISETENLDEIKLLDFLSEAGVLTALNIAESIRTKIATIGQLKKMVDARQLENKVRDYIYENPWIVHPQWETFRKEKSVKNMLKDLGAENLKGDDFNGRVDLALSSGSDLLLLEFMRPGLEIDKDHLDRINYYVGDIRDALKRETANNIKTLNFAYVIADDHKMDRKTQRRIEQLENENILVMKWETLIAQSIIQWEEHLDLLKERYPDDDRIQNL